MHIRPLEAHELDLFAGINTDAAHVPSIREYLDRLLTRNVIRVDGCFVAERDGQPIARVAFWNLSSTPAPTDLILLDVPWQQPNGQAVGQQLLDTVLQTARTLGSTSLGHVLDSPPVAPQWQFHADERIRLLESAGFRMERHAYRFEWQSAGKPLPFPEGLTFRSLPDVGEAAFLDAIARVSEGTFDQRIREDRERLGVAGEARLTFDDLRSMEYDPAWWQLAYAPDGALVGLIMPCKNPTFAVIGYIGVVPEQRGRGYVNLLLQQGTATLHAAGATVVRADTDVSNFPMANAFRRAGYTEFATRREYRVAL